MLWLHQRQGFEATVTCYGDHKWGSNEPQKMWCLVPNNVRFFLGGKGGVFGGVLGWIIYAKPWSKEMSKCHLFAPPGVGLKLCDFLMWLRILTIVPSSLHQHRWLCFNHKSMLSYTVDVNVFGICVNHSLTGRTLSYTEFWFWRHNLEEIGISSTESWQSFNMAWQAPWRKFNHGLSNSWKSMGVGHNAYEKKKQKYIYIYIYISVYTKIHASFQAVHPWISRHLTTFSVSGKSFSCNNHHLRYHDIPVPWPQVPTFLWFL